MAQFSRILFPVDLSGIGAKIIPHVQMMVECHKAELHLLHVLEMFSSNMGMMEAHIDLGTVTKQLREQVEKQLDQMAAEHFSGAGNVTKVIAEGRPGQQIRDYAKKNNMDLIIMASHARKGLDYAFFGSVANKVARGSEVPVLLINPTTLEKK